MFIIDNRNVMKIIQGDTGVIRLKLQNYELSEGDSVIFTVIDKSLVVEMSARTMAQDNIIRKEVTTFELDGSAVIEILSEDTELLTPKTYSYDIQVNTKDGRVDTVVPANKFTVYEGISR